MIKLEELKEYINTTQPNFHAYVGEHKMGIFWMQCADDQERFLYRFDILDCCELHQLVVIKDDWSLRCGESYFDLAERYWSVSDDISVEKVFEDIVDIIVEESKKIIEFHTEMLSVLGFVRE